MSPGGSGDRAFIERSVRLAIIAATTLGILLVARDRESPFCNLPEESHGAPPTASR